MNKKLTALQTDFSKHGCLKVGVISDTHGSINVHVQNHLQDCEVILHAGDIGSINVINQLKSISHNVIPIRGNNDVAAKWPAHEHKELKIINELAEIKLPGGIMVVTHGDKFNPVASRHKKLRENFPTAKAIVYGHSHQLVCDQSDTPWILNPGAAGKNRTKGGASCLVVLTSKDQWAISEFRAEL